MKRHAFLAAATAWLAVVAVGATLVWAVISRTGQELMSGDGLEGAGPVDSSAEAIRTTGPDQPLKHRKVRPDDASGSPTDSPSAQPTGSPSSVPSGAESRPPGDGPDDGQPHDAPSSPSPSVRTATWKGPPGAVTISCKGSALQPNFVVLPSSGWGLDDKPEVSSSHLEVHFKKDDDQGEYELTAGCEDGRPEFHGHSDD